MDLAVSFGPGNHEHLLKKAILANDNGFKYARFWPTYKVGQVHKNGKDEILKTSSLYDTTSFLAYGVWNKLKSVNQYQWHQDILFRLFDYLAKDALKNADLLLAWAQVGLSSMQEVKKTGGVAVLEHPMVHVNTWMRLMEEEFKAHGKAGGVKYSLFTPTMVKRMQQEYETADYINVISTYSKNTFLENGVPEKKLILTPLGIDTEAFKPFPHRPDNSTFKVIYVGRLELLKGVHYLLKAFAEANLVAAELFLVGRILPEMQPYLEKYQGHYKYLGTKTQEELIDLYQHADVLVLPSIQESFGLVLAEAMACGVPVIATENSGGPDLIEEGTNGFLIPIRDSDTLKIRLQYLYQNREDLYSLQQSARNTIVERFNSESYTNGIKNLINLAR